MSSDHERVPQRGHHAKWLAWLTLAAGAAMCVVAVLLS